MKIFLIILGIYPISLLILFITNYIEWISDKNSEGTTVNDLHYWIVKDPIDGGISYFLVFLLYCPFINTVIAIFELFSLFGLLLKNTIGKINIR